MPDAGTTIFLPPEDTVRVWQARDELRPTVRWSEMMHEEHSSAFTVAKIARLDLLAAVRSSLDEVIRNGGTFEEWKASIGPELQKAGWWGVVRDPTLTGTSAPVIVNDRRLRTIYRTNIRMSVSAGKWRRVLRQRDQFPYLRYRSDHPRRYPREQHLGWHGLILPVEHVFWQEHFPPNGWGCNCDFDQVSEAMLRRRGWKVSDDPPAEKRVPFYPAGRSTPIMVPKGIDPGFSYNPGTAHIQALADKLARSTALAEEIGLRGPAARTRQAVSHVMRDLLLQERPDRAGIGDYVTTALRDPDLQDALPLGFARIAQAEGDFERLLPAETIRKTMRLHGETGPRRDTYPIVDQDWALIPLLVERGARHVRKRGNETSIAYVLRLGDLDYVYSERIGTKRGLRLRGATFFKAKRYQQ